MVCLPEARSKEPSKEGPDTVALLAAVIPSVSGAPEKGIAAQGTGLGSSLPSEDPALLVLTRAVADDAGGRPAVSTDGLLALNRELHAEIRKRRRAEERLLRVERRYRLLFDNSLDGIYQATPEGRLLSVNPAMARILGYGSAEELLAAFGSGADFHGQRERHEEFARSLMEAGEIKEFETRVRCRDGRVIWILENARLVPGEGDERITFIGTVKDITARKEAELALYRLAATVEQTSQAMVITDRHFIVTYVNGAFERMTGLDRAEAVGEDASRFFGSPTAAGPQFPSIIEALGEQGQWTGRYREKQPDGQAVSKEVSAFAIRDPQGGIINYCFTERDITPETKMEGQLRQAKKMEAMGTLAGGIAHDFNNLLAGIVACIEMAIDALDENSEAMFELGEALKACGYAKDMVRQILSFSRQGDTEKSPISIAPILKEAMFLLRAGLPPSVEMSYSIQAESDVVMGDPSQINQLVMNLCTNGLQAMQPDGGRLTVTLTDMALSAAEARSHPGLSAGRYVSLCVSDTGHGMDSEIMERIFDPFFTTRKRGDGVGLGLSVVHGIVSDLGGQISVESEPGRGAVFTVLLPAAKACAAPVLPDHGTQPQGDERILLVEDEGLLASALRRLLEGLGYHVTMCGQASEALGVFLERTSDIDLLITDLTMPGMSGLDLAREVKSVRPDLPVILCTGYAEVLRSDDVRELGIAALISKPFQKCAVAHAIRRVLDQE